MNREASQANSYQQPLPALEVAAKEGTKRGKSIKLSDRVEAGKDHFDAVVVEFLEKVVDAKPVKRL